MQSKYPSDNFTMQLIKMTKAKVKDAVRMRGIIRYVYKKMGKAILEYGMLSPGDKILIGVSGGVDSLSLLKLFMMRKQRVPVQFDFIACFVSSNFIKVDEDILLEYFRNNRIPFVRKQLLLDDSDMNCFWCSWNRRKVLFEAATEYGCNKIALGHHLDDIAATILMNLFFFGEVSAMKPKINLFEGRLSVIRPLCYVGKEDIHTFASKLNLPFTSYECMYGKDSRRALIKSVIQAVEKNCPHVKKNIFAALQNIRKEYLV